MQVTKLDQEVCMLAAKSGWSGLFATLTLDDARCRLEYARSIGDAQGIMLAMMLLQNASAYRHAWKKLRGAHED